MLQVRRNVNEDSSWGDRNSGNDNKFKGSDYLPFEEDVTVNITDISWSLSESIKSIFKFNYAVKSQDIQSFCHFPGKTALLFSPIAASSDT